jgi:hypothetical protein
MITLNVFIAVMTNSVQEELIQDIKNIDRSNDHQIKEMNQKIDLILDELKKQKS